MLRLSAHQHSIRSNTTLFELLDEKGELVAGIYATERGLKIVSKYISNRSDLIQIEAVPPPAILVNLRPMPDREPDRS